MSLEDGIRLAYQLGILLAWWCAAWLLLDTAMLPAGVGFALLLLYLVAKFVGKLVSALSSRLPPLLGMLLTGLVLRNLPGEPLRADHYLLGHSFDWWSVKLRTFALAVIMLRAGLGLDLTKLRALGGATARLAACPCFAEAVAVTLLSAVLLDFPVVWGGTLGFVVAAVSPAVVVPGMLDLKARGYGTQKGVPTMVVAAASFDDVLAIAGFGICLALAASYESGTSTEGTLGVAWLALKAPVELLTGIVSGVLLGTFVARGSSTHGFSDTWHVAAALSAVLITVFGGKKINFSGGGALGALVFGATTASFWPAAKHKAVQTRVNELWTLVQPALFGLLGAAVKLDALDQSQFAGAFAVLGGALAVRISVTRLALLGSGLNPSEAHLVCLAWIPKATVQAAVGGTALDLMQERDLGSVAEERGRLVLMISVLVILLTAPAGAICISTFGPMWLSHDVDRVAELEAPAKASEAPAKEVEAPVSAPESDVEPGKASATVCQACVHDSTEDATKADISKTAEV